MAFPLKYNTASQEVPLGYFLDSSDGDTEETGLTIANTDIKLWKSGSTTLANKNSGGAAHISNGVYYATMDATDTNAYGPLVIFVHISGALTVRLECVVMEADAYDALYAASGTGHIEADVVQVSGDASAADNLESQYDTAGLTGDTFPATQAQAGNIATGAGGLSALISAFAKVGAEPETNTYVATQEGDGVYHIVEDDGGNTDFYYEATVSAGAKATAFKWVGYIQSNGDTVDVYYWDWVSSTYKQITSPGGSNGTTPIEEVFDVPVGATGTGANEGKARLRFDSTTTTAIATDKLLCEFSQASVTVGYANGAIWINTNASNTNTVDFVDGTADNPVSTWAAALTLSASLGITRFEISNGSSITLSGNSDGYTLLGHTWTIALNGQSIAGTHVENANVSGIGTGATPPLFEGCHFSNATLPPAHLTDCGLGATITAGSTGDFFFDVCHSSIAGTSTPVFDFGAALNASNLNMRGYSGGIEIQNMGAGTGSYDMSLEGHGQLVINANCSATSTIAIRGHFPVTDNAGGAVTLSRDGNYVESEIVDAAWDEILTGATHNITNSAARILRQIQEGGYENAAVWIDTVNGAPGGDGTVTDPVDDITAALVVAVAANYRRLEYVTGSSDTLVAAVDGYCIHGFGYTLALGGQSIAGSRIHNAMISGVCTGATPEFRKCTFGNVTLPPCTIRGGAFSGVMTISGAGDYYLSKCFSAIAGTGLPTFDFGAAVGSTDLNIRHYSGGVHIHNIGRVGTDNMSLEGDGQLILNANCVGGTIAIRGHFTVTDNAGDVVTLSDDARYDIQQINDQVDLGLSDYDGPTKAEMDSGHALLATEAKQDVIDANLDSVLVDTGTTLPAEHAALNDLSAADALSQASAALVAIHLDHLLAVDYDPTSKPGVATALLNELVEGDGGVSRYTANALEQAPTGGSAPTVGQIVDGVWDEQKAGHVAGGSMGEEVQSHATSPEIAALNDLTSAEVGDAVLDEPVEGALTLRNAARLILAFTAGRTSGGSTPTVTFRDQANTKDRIVMTVDADGDRSATVVDGS